MSTYLLLKFVHVFAAIVAVGTNLTYVYWLRRARTAGPPSDVVMEGVAALDRRVANPAYVVLPVTGIIMVIIGDIGFSTFWVATAIGLYIAVGVVAGVAFSPALRRQVELARGGDAGGADYGAVARRTMMSGATTMALVAIIIFLMVVKPS